MRCANEPGWYEPIWRLIVSENTQPEDLEDVMETELVHVVIEIIHIVMWTGIIGSDIAAWIVSDALLYCLTPVFVSVYCNSSITPTFKSSGVGL